MTNKKIRVNNYISANKINKTIMQSAPHTLLIGFEESNYSKALQQRNLESNRYYKGQEVPWFSSLPHFKIYGTGIYLFFSFIKHITILFLILTIISIAPMVVNFIKGSNYRNSEGSLSVYLTKSSMGSHKYALMTASNAYELSITFKIINVAFDILSCTVYLGFCLFWEKKSRKIAQHISKQIKLQSDFTIQVVEFPAGVKEITMEQFMNKFGNVTEVVAARDYTKELEIAQAISQKQVQIRMIEIEGDEKQKQQVNTINEQILVLYQEMDKISVRDHEITKYFVQYDSPQERMNVVKKFEDFQGFCGCCRQVPDSMLIKGERVKVTVCNTEPSGVLWENAHFTWRMRAPRYLLQVLIILLIIVGGFIFISFLNILIPPIDSNIDTSNLDYDQIKNGSNSTVTKAWCIQNFDINGNGSPYASACNSYWQLYVKGVLISVSISVVVIVLCQVIQKIVYALAYLQRYTTRAEQSVTIMTNLFIMNFLTTTLITFLMQANIFSLSVMSFLDKMVTSSDLKNNIISMSEYSDMTSSWYKDIGYQIWMNIFMLIFIPHAIEPIYYFLMEKVSECLAKREKIQRKMVERLSSSEFEVESHYADLLLIISTGFIFGGGIQLMMVVVFLCLFIRLYYYRFLFVRFSKVPPHYNEVLNDRVIFILKVVLLLRCLISLYMYGGDDVFAMEKSTFMKWASSLGVPVFASIFVVFSRILLTWYYSMFVILFILVLIFKEPLFILGRKIKNCCKSRNTENKQVHSDMVGNEILVNNNSDVSKNKGTSDELNENNLQNTLSAWLSNENETIRSQRNLIKSYRLENNPFYASLLAIMKLKSRKTNQINSKDNINLQTEGNQMVKNTQHEIKIVSK